jgi:hypothetical protein
MLGETFIDVDKWRGGEGNVPDVEMSTSLSKQAIAGGLTYLSVEARFTVLCSLIPEGWRFHG